MILQLRAANNPSTQLMGIGFWYNDERQFIRVFPDIKFGDSLAITRKIHSLLDEGIELEIHPIVKSECHKAGFDFDELIVQ